jgi:hypothetical protein
MIHKDNMGNKMRWFDYITIWLGLGICYNIKYEWLSKDISNMTIGIHGQEWEGSDGSKSVDINQLYIGLLFIRFVFEFFKG